MSDAAAAASATAQLELRIEHILAGARPVTVDDVCSICMEKLSNDAEQDFVACEHCHGLFHHACIARTESVRDERPCPLCREDVSTSITTSKFTRRLFKRDRSGKWFARDLARLLRSAMRMYLHGGVRVLGCDHILCDIARNLASVIEQEPSSTVGYMLLCARVTRRGNRRSNRDAFLWIKPKELGAPELMFGGIFTDLCMAITQSLDGWKGFRLWVCAASTKFNDLIDSLVVDCADLTPDVLRAEYKRRNRLLDGMRAEFQIILMQGGEDEPEDDEDA